MDTLGAYDSSSGDEGSSGGGRGGQCQGMSRYVKELRSTVLADKKASASSLNTTNTTSSSSSSSSIVPTAAYIPLLAPTNLLPDNVGSTQHHIIAVEEISSRNSNNSNNSSNNNRCSSIHSGNDGANSSDDDDDDDDFGPSLPSGANQTSLDEMNHTVATNRMVKHDGSGSSTIKNSHSGSNSNSNSNSIIKNSSSDSNHGSSEEIAIVPVLPVSHQLDLHGHTKAVTCFSVDPSGNRVVSGSYDYNVKIYDFGGMDSRGEAFRTFEAFEAHPVTSISHSSNGDRFIVGTTSMQPRVYTRDAQLIITFVRGDGYIRDLCNTKGHTNEVTCVLWHPTKVDTVLTSSLDGSVRIWDLKGEALFGNLINKHVLKIRASSDGKRVGARCFAISSSGGLIVAGATDGSLHFWVEKKAYSRTDHVVNSAHIAGKSNVNVQSVLLNSDASLLYSRGEDNTIKIWSIKKLSAVACVKTFTDVPSIYLQSNLYLSPDETVLVCGVSSYKEQPSALGNSNSNSNNSNSNSNSNSTDGGGEKKSKSLREILSHLSFFDVSKRNLTSDSTRERVGQITLPENASIIYLKWVHTTNQIVCSLSTGTIRVFYDPSVSKKGVMISAAKKVSRKEMGVTAADFGIGTQQIITPHAMPLFRKDDGPKKRKKDEPRDPMVPAKPNLQGPEHNPNTSFFFTQYVMEGKAKADDLMRDPRQALFEVAEKAKADPQFFGKAYQDNVAPLADKTFEEEAAEFKKKQRSFEDRDK